jgi:hypothetical protein
MPVEIMPPMYSMLQEETQKAIKQVRKSDKKRDNKDAYIYIVYRMSPMYLNGTCLSQKHIEKSHPV